MAVAAKCGRRHAQLAGDTVIGAAARAVAGLVDGVGDAAIVAQSVLEPVGPLCLLILTRADAQSALEQPLEIEGTHTDMTRQSLQRHRALRMVVQVAARGLDHLPLKV